jgi:hypothetical protein
MKQNTTKHNFKKYVVSAKCYSLYDYEDSYDVINGKLHVSPGEVCTI